MQDPLNVAIPLDEVETSLPLIPEQDVSVTCTESSVDPNKDKTGFNWNLTLCTTSPLQSTDGRTINPNFPLYLTIGLQPAAETKDPEGFKRNLAATVDALFGSSKENRPAFTRELVSSAVGKQAIAHVFIDEYQGVQRSKIKRLKKA